MLHKMSDSKNSILTEACPKSRPDVGAVYSMVVSLLLLNQRKASMIVAWATGTDRSEQGGFARHQAQDVAAES